MDDLPDSVRPNDEVDSNITLASTQIHHSQSLEFEPNYLRFNPLKICENLAQYLQIFQSMKRFRGDGVLKSETPFCGEWYLEFGKFQKPQRRFQLNSKFNSPQKGVYNKINIKPLM